MFNLTHKAPKTTNMSQEQPMRPQVADAAIQEQPVKYGDVFPVSGQLARRPITPQDAAMMQSAENMVIGKTQKGGAASVMQSAATQNEKAGFVGHSDLINVDQGMTVSETDFPGGRIVSESIGGQVVGQYIEPMAKQVMPVISDTDPITIGEALEATALRLHDKPVDQSDAAAIQAAEVRASGTNAITPGGVAAAAQSAANVNARLKKDTNKTKLGDILTDATEKLPTDKPAMLRDAEGVMNAEMRNNPNLATHTGGVAESLVTAARLNQ